MQHNFVLQLLTKKSKAGVATHLAVKESFQRLNNFRYLCPLQFNQIIPGELTLLQTSLHICKACLTAVAFEVETLKFRTVLILLLFMNSVFLS